VRRLLHGVRGVVTVEQQLAAPTDQPPDRIASHGTVLGLGNKIRCLSPHRSMIHLDSRPWQFSKTFRHLETKPHVRYAEILWTRGVRGIAALDRRDAQ
jgi:hypothetical protein